MIKYVISSITSKFDISRGCNSWGVAVFLRLWLILNLLLKYLFKHQCTKFWHLCCFSICIRFFSFRYRFKALTELKLVPLANQNRFELQILRDWKKIRLCSQGTYTFQDLVNETLIIADYEYAKRSSFLYRIKSYGKKTPTKQHFRINFKPSIEWT